MTLSTFIVLYLRSICLAIASISSVAVTVFVSALWPNLIYSLVKIVRAGKQPEGRAPSPRHPAVWLGFFMSLAAAVCTSTVVAFLPPQQPVSPAASSMIIPSATAPQTNSTVTNPEEVRVLANNDFGTDTGLVVQQGDSVTFSASGTWCWGGLSDCSNANGTAGRPSGPQECCTTLKGEQFGKLLGRVGDWIFPIGEKATIIMWNSGELFLLMNDRVGTYGDNNGAISVQIMVSFK